MSDMDAEIKRLQEQRKLEKGDLVPLGSVSFDKDLYGAGDKSQFTSVVEDVDLDDEDVVDTYRVGQGVGAGGTHPATLKATLSADRIAQQMKAEAANDDHDDAALMSKFAEGGSGRINTRIADRESDYHNQARQRRRALSPEREGRSYKDIMAEQERAREKEELLKRHAELMENRTAGAGAGVDARPPPSDGDGAAPRKERKRRRWDDAAPVAAPVAPPAAADTGSASTVSVDSVAASATGSEWDRDSSTNRRTRRRNRWDATPTAEQMSGQGGMAATPLVSAGAGAASGKRSRWDETPVSLQSGIAATPVVGAGGASLETPVISAGAAMALAASRSGIPLTGDDLNAQRHVREMVERNRPLTDEDLNELMPSKGYKILEPPADYRPQRSLHAMLLATPTPMTGGAGFTIPQTPVGASAVSKDEYGVPAMPAESGLPAIKPEDMQYFGALVEDKDPESLTHEEAKDRRIMALLLKIKNGTPPQRKSSLRLITEKARELGAGQLFKHILPLLMSPQLEDQERHLLVKVIDRVLYKLDDLVRPYVHKILVVIQPLLIDEDYYARVEGREVISNLAKAAGLATMISTMRPDIDNPDEYVRNTTARAFAVVGSALGIPALLPFLKAVCASRKSWQARHTGVKIVQQIAILMGCAVLPHLKNLVGIVQNGLQDEQQKVRTITALCLAALAEAAHPYGIESFDDVLEPLWEGIRTHRGKGLAAFLKAVGFIIPLMDAQYAEYYTREVMPIVRREFQTPDEEMKKIVLKVVEQCVGTDGIDAAYVRTEVLPDFFKFFWVRRMALDRRNSKQLVETTVELANKVGVSDMLGPRIGSVGSGLVGFLKDESEPFRKMAMDAIEKIILNLGAADVDARLEEAMIDGLIYAFQEQNTDDTGTIINGFGTVVSALGVRTKAYLPQICGTIKWRLNNKSAKVRMQAADLISKIAIVMKACGEEQKLGHLGVVLYECLGEEYPEVLGSILGGLKAIVNVIGMTNMQPPIKDLLPRLTPILRNRHEKVQENAIDLIGRIADRGAEMVSPKEWMRVCFDLLELLKAHKKAIRRATVNTFGYIAKAIGPQDVLHTLLNNLKVQERQNRVCTTIAIAIVAETCQPFTVLPALLNEYRVRDMNVQNGVLKALSFLFEYIGEMGKDYLGACLPLLEDALTDRDMVHRQTASATIRHMALGVVGLSCEDEMSHLLNFVWPNIFEKSPHVIQAVMEAIEGMRCAIGPYRILNYTLPGLWHPARRVRDVYWRLYNNLYVYCQDALTPYYPRLLDDEANTYRRTYLELFL